MEITRSDVLTLALILSLGLNIYDVLKRFPHCDDTDRFSDKELPFGGNEVSHTWAKDHVEAYREAHATDVTPYQTTGFMLSKKVFDKIFDNTQVEVAEKNIEVIQKINIAGAVPSKLKAVLIYNAANSDLFVPEENKIEIENFF